MALPDGARARAECELGPNGNGSRADEGRDDVDVEDRRQRQMCIRDRLGFLLTLVVAGLVGWAADAVVPGRLPGGWIGAVLAGIVGGFIGTLALGKIGPTVFDINLIPAFIRAAAIAVVAELAIGSRSRAVR